MKIIISEQGKGELKRLGFDIETSIREVLDFLPKSDLVGLAYIYVTDVPELMKKHLKDALAAYYYKKNIHQAHIRIYLKRIFGSITNAESFHKILPVMNITLAHILYHEVGHHAEHSRRHGIKKDKKELFADSYADYYLAGYISDNICNINGCIKELERLADDVGVSIDTVNALKSTLIGKKGLASEKKSPPDVSES